ncbi:MAG TPA: mechanosensitive ion channel [bacterium]|nr:mechanosensitive ion channel [bacterium]HPN33857.1 mechanosensitive ion channel [bacterium]
MKNNGILDTINILIIETEVKLISSLILVLLIWLLRSIVLRLLSQRIKDERTRELSRQIVGYTAFLLGLVLIGRLWLEGFQSLLIVLTLLLAAMILSLKELILNIASWSVIAWRQLFKIGDHIRIGEHYGEVVEMNMIYITLVELDERLPSEPAGHRVIKIPNNLVLTQPIVNDTEGAHALWYEIQVALRLDSDWQDAQQTLERILQQRMAAAEIENLEDAPPVQVSVRVHAGALLLTGRYFCTSEQQPEIEEELWQQILSAFQPHGRIHLV